MLLDAEATLEMLRRYGLKAPKTALCSDRADVLDEASRLRFPQVLKASSREETHKTEKGLVQLGIQSLDEMSDAFSRLERKTRTFSVDAYVVQEQVRGVEFILGGHKDPTFGKTVLFGLGGVFAELFDETAIRVLPITKRNAQKMLEQTKAAAFFKPGGFRGKVASAEKAVDAVLKAAKMMQRENVVSFDINPLMVNEREALSVDARIVME